VLVALPEPHTILQEENNTLDARQSRCHQFVIEGGPRAAPPGVASNGAPQAQYVFDITVTIVRAFLACPVSFVCVYMRQGRGGGGLGS
jgi:hypothetical protein